MNFRNNFFQNNNVPGQQGPMGPNVPQGNFGPAVNNFNNPMPNNNFAPNFEQPVPAYPSRFNASNQVYAYNDPNQNPQAPGYGSGYSPNYRRVNRSQYRRPYDNTQGYDNNQNYAPYPPARENYNEQQAYDQYERDQYSRVAKPVAKERRNLAYGTSTGVYNDDVYNYDDYYDEPAVREEDSRKNHKSRFFTKLANRRKAREEEFENERDDRAYRTREDERRERRKPKSRRREEDDYDDFEDEDEDDDYEESRRPSRSKKLKKRSKSRYEDDDYDDFEDEDEDDDYEESRRPSRSKKLKKRSKSRYEDDDYDDFEDEDEDEDEDEPKSRKKGFFSGPVDFFKKKKRG